ncbi:MAG: hypothetical protein R6V73_08430 [Anaerolineales bacterium]|jgi:hypothetical protein
MKTSLKAHDNRKSTENGQGVLEYSVIIVLVVIILISFVALFGVDLFNQFVSNRAKANDQPATQAPAEPLVELSEIGALAEVFETEIIRIENCPNGDVYNPNLERQYWLEYEIELDNQITPDLRPQVISGLQSLYSFTQGSREELTLSLNLEAPPDSIVDYTIDWQYIWNEGNVLVTQAEGTSQSYLYRARTDLEYLIVDMAQRACETTPAP